MAIVINGSGTVTGLAVGGLPDGTVDAGTLATNSVDSAELVNGSVDAVKLASGVGGKLLKATSLVNTTRAALSTSADYWLSFGTVSKISATSSLIVSASVSGFNDSSGICGSGIRIDSTYRYGTYIYAAAANGGRDWNGQFDFGTMGGSGTKTVYWGWKPANGVVSAPFQILNPTASDDARSQSTRSTITVWEVEA